MEGIKIWECRFCERRVPKKLYIFHDTFCKKTPSRVRNYHTTPNSAKTKYMLGGLMEISKKFKKIIEISVEKKTNKTNRNSQNEEETHITLDIETDPIWLEFEKEIQNIRNTALRPEFGGTRAGMPCDHALSPVTTLTLSLVFLQRTKWSVLRNQADMTRVVVGEFESLLWKRTDQEM